MAKTVDQLLQLFGSTVNGASEVGVFGSGATGSPTYTSSITLMQSLGAWNRGWAAETIANNRPFLEDMNAVDCVFGYQLFYIKQMGIVEWNSGNTYYINSITQSSGTVWQSLVDTNIGNNPATSPTAWKTLFPITGLLGAWSATYSFATIYKAPTDLLVFAYTSGGAGVGPIEIMTDSSSTPSTVRGESFLPGTVSGATVFTASAVKKGDYWEASGADTTPQGLNVIPIGV